MKNFSIIIPHKNIPELLERCLASIPQRDDIQIIVADDNSDISYFENMEYLGAKYPYVEFIFAKDKKRRGAGYARNIGLEHARGKWLIFADADDFFNQPAFEEALDKYKDSDADMVCFSNNSVDSDDITIAKENVWFSMHEQVNATLEQNNLDIIRYNTGVVWARFIKRDLVERINAKFQETICRNDTLFSVQTGCHAKEIVLDNSLEIYCYTQRQKMFETKAGRKTRYKVSKTVMRYLRKQQKGLKIFNGDFYFHYQLLKEENKMLYIKDFPSVLLLTTTKRRAVKDFMQWIKAKVVS
jgi:glycosyltransferase involved in cell wall biosynthesis